MKKKSIAFLVTLFVAGFNIVIGQVSAPFSEKTRSKHEMKIQVDGIDNSNTDEVTRVACTLFSMPHTSSRIDSAAVKINGVVYKATDIDGVDFQRYFQWEDEGAVPVEIDFKKSNMISKGDSIFLYTVHGRFGAPLK